MRLPVPRARLPDPLDGLSGLTAGEVIERRARYGDNLILEVRPRSLAERARETAADPMLWFLLTTAGAYLLLGETLEAITLLLAIVPLTGMDAFLHHRTRASTQALEGSLAARATVIREARSQDVPARELVVGDLVLIRAGESVPADGVLVQAEQLRVEEAALTGEAYPVHKQVLAAPLSDGEAPPVETLHWGLAGTRVLTGRGLLRVVRTGTSGWPGSVPSGVATSSKR